MVDLYIDALKIQLLLHADVNMLQIIIISIVVTGIIILICWNSLLLTICIDFFQVKS
jgi:hypothetical protein